MPDASGNILDSGPYQINIGAQLGLPPAGSSAAGTAKQFGVPPIQRAVQVDPERAAMAAVSDASNEFGVPYDQIIKMWQREGGMRVLGVPTTNDGRDVGPFQISPGAVEAVNKRYGTNFTLEDRQDYRKAAKIAAGYLRMMNDQFGSWDAAQAAYQTGPEGYAEGVRPQAGGATDISLPPQIQGMFTEIRSLSAAKQREMQPLIDETIQQWRDTQPLVKRAFSKLLDSEVDPSKHPQPPIPQSNPLAAFSSVAGIFAMIAAGFSRTPAIAALNGLAGAINGARNADLETYKQQYQAWKDNLDIAFKRHEEMAADYTAAINLLSTDLTGAKAALQAVALKYDDPRAQLFNEMDAYEKIVTLQNQRQAQIDLMKLRREDIYLKDAQIKKDTAEAEKAQAPLDALKEVISAQKELDAAEAEGNQDKIKAAQKKLELAQRHRDEVVATLSPRTITMGSEHAQAVEEYRRQHPEASRADAINAVSGKQQGALTNDAVDMAARTYLRTGQMPYLGFGASQSRIQVINRAAEMAQANGHTIDDYIEGRAQLKADTADLQKMQLMRDSAVAYERSAENEFNLAVANIPSTPEPLNMQLLTRWARTGEKQFGDTQVPKFMTALISALDEYAKVLTGGTGSVAASTDSARNQALALIPEGATTKQIPAIVNTIKQGMSFKIDSYDEQLNEIRSRIGGGHPQTLKAPPTPEAGQATQGTRAEHPPIPSSLQNEADLWWSPSLQKWYDKDGNAYLQDGSPEATARVQQPTVIRP